MIEGQIWTGQLHTPLLCNTKAAACFFVILAPHPS